MSRAGSLARRLINTGMLCMVVGAVLALGGAVRTFRFLAVVHTYETVTARQLVRELIIPHMTLLLGLGLLTASLILATRAVVIGKRRQQKDV